MTQIFSELLLESRCKDEVIQEFCPLAESLDWLLGQLFYRKRGSLAFRSSRSAVPYEVTSDGNLSASAAELLFSDLESQGDVPGQIIVLELGAGSGLFAKCFLDIFRDINRLRRKDYYDRLLYVVTDASASMLSDLDCCKMLHQHSEHVEIRQGDILSDGFGKSRMPLKGSVRAIFANYFLDSLPATVLRVHNEQLSELRVRTRLQRSRFRDAATLSIDQVSEISKSADPSRLECLLDRTSDFVLEYDYFKVSPSDIPFGEFVLRSCPKLANESGSLGQPSYIVHNYGAFECIRRSRELLCPGGYIVLSDYGQVDGMTTVPNHLHQRFAGASAIGLNFPLLSEFAVVKCESQCLQPQVTGNDIHTRLICYDASDHVKSAFTSCYGASSDKLREPLAAARQLAEDGSWQEALNCYFEAMERQPYNWSLIAEAARFCMYSLKDPILGAKLAQLGIDRNPLTCADLWNTLGDAAACLKQEDHAERAFLRAIEIDPDNVRARFNLASLLESRQDFFSALRMVTECLCADRCGEYEQRLICKQMDILRELKRWHHEDCQRSTDRFHRSLYSSEQVT